VSILVLQPTRPTNPPALRAKADALLARMLAANLDLSFDIHQDNDPLETVLPHPSRYTRHAAIRNYMLDMYLRDEHTHVLWIDSDLVEYPALLPRLLLDTGADIAAPLPILDPSPGRLLAFPRRDRFYDIAGFIEQGKRSRMFQPWFDQTGDVIELDSVGCCYIIPASLFQDGVRYSPPSTDYYVEHWSVMRAAKRRGMRIVALTTVQVVHAWLPDYGLEPS
jgi:hypothetical protein